MIKQKCGKNILNIPIVLFIYKRTIHFFINKNFWEGCKRTFFVIISLSLLYVISCNNDSKSNFRIGAHETNKIGEVSGEKSEIGAILASREFVVNMLPNANMAQFPGYNIDVTKESNDLYIIKSYVDTRKDCGPKARRHYTCLLKFESGKWVLEEVKFF